ncbi:diguanylate cyclase [Vibrio sonorensis]|uniref:diguanylate cyclase n=1 Tax=Vibrio sonorensis TaxID=1004316 RepID=UPI00316AD466
MALPKLLIRTLKPYIILLSVGMLYLAYQQFNESEKRAYQQSFANLSTASKLVSAQVEAAVSKLYLLSESEDIEHFESSAQQILKHSENLADVLYVNQSSDYFYSAAKGHIDPNKIANMVWKPLDNFDGHVFVSSVYPSYSGAWAVAVRYQFNRDEEVWIEFDLIAATEGLSGLTTLKQGYVYVVDRTTGRLIFHPDLKRIGSLSVSYHGGIDELVNNKQGFGTHEYYYQSNYKISVFDAENPYNWVYISGTDRADILATSYQLSLSAVVIASLLLLAVAVNYLTIQLNHALAKLNMASGTTDFKQQLRLIMDRFCYHGGVQFCLYDKDFGHFSTLDYHGNQNIVLTDEKLASCFTADTISFIEKKYADPLAKKLKVDGRHYAIPLFDKSGLIGVIYMKALFPTYRSLLRIIRDYSQVSLSNLLLNKKLISKDVMTQLDNKMTLRAAIEQHTERENTYLAIIDIDHFKRINDTYGHQFGDAVILHTADVMHKCFPKPSAISLARFGGEEFCILFHANDEQDAFDQCEILRQLIEKATMCADDQMVNFSISVGVTNVKENQNSTVGRADKAYIKQKDLGVIK